MRRLVFTEATVVDGSGAPAAVRDLFIEGDRIARVAPPGESHDGYEVIRAAGTVLMPGFIDVHSHADRGPFRLDADASKILQGITTEVTGNCGSSPLTGPGDEDARHPVRYLEALDAARPVTNLAPLLGHGSLRGLVVGLEARAPSSREMRDMRQVLEMALDRGAFGLSSGLFYAPGSYADSEELSELLAGFQDRPLVYASHIRNEGNALVEAVDEFLAVGLETGVPLQLSHHKAAGIPNWGKTTATLARVRELRQDGIRVALDVYPYTASSTDVSANLPRWVLEGGVEEAIRRLQDETLLPRIQHECEVEPGDWESMVAATGYDRMVIATTQTGRGAGQTLADYAAGLGLTPFQGMVQLLIENALEATMVVHSMHEDDLLRVLRDPWCWIGTDGGNKPAEGRPHPRLTGTFPRVLARYVREQGVLSLEEAVRRMTDGPARHFHIPDRGRVAAGWVADLVWLDGAAVTDGSTFEEPLTPPHGIRGVFLDGVQVVDGARYVGERRAHRLRPETA
jgi:N-acyl-D-amino-acid deacylase